MAKSTFKMRSQSAVKKSGFKMMGSSPTKKDLEYAIPGDTLDRVKGAGEASTEAILSNTPGKKTGSPVKRKSLYEREEKQRDAMQRQAARKELRSIRKQRRSDTLADKGRGRRSDRKYKKAS